MNVSALRYIRNTNFLLSKEEPSNLIIKDWRTIYLQLVAVWTHIGKSYQELKFLLFWNEESHAWRYFPKIIRKCLLIVGIVPSTPFGQSRTFMLRDKSSDWGITSNTRYCSTCTCTKFLHHIWRAHYFVLAMYKSEWNFFELVKQCRHSWTHFKCPLWFITGNHNFQGQPHEVDIGICTEMAHNLKT